MIRALPKYPFSSDHLVLADGNKAVVGTPFGHLCGYVAIPADQVPAHWHGNYYADALQYLSVHGGLTYCQVGGGDDDARYAAAKTAQENGPTRSVDAWITRRQMRQDALRSVPYTHVVFGFDCGHAGDDDNPLLRDPQHVMELAAQMEQQILAYAARLPEWLEANRERRIAIMEEICESAARKTELGFGALISAMAGAKEMGEPS